MTIIINSYNQCESILACLDGVLSQVDIKSPLEIIIVDDGSDDNTLALARVRFSRETNLDWKSFVFARKGGVLCRQFGLSNAKNEHCLLLGGDFILTDRTIVSRLAESLVDKVAFASLYGPHGGMGTVYRRSLVLSVGGFYLGYNRFGSGYRDDSDLYYQLQSRGYISVFNPQLQNCYSHRQRRTKGFRGALHYAISRVLIHELDSLLFKRHPDRFRIDFPMIGRVLVDPRWDYLRASGRWRRRDKIELSSPQGVVLMHGRTSLARLTIRCAAMVYAVSLIFVRMCGSFRYRTWLL